MAEEIEKNFSFNLKDECKMRLQIQKRYGTKFNKGVEAVQAFI